MIKIELNEAEVKVLIAALERHKRLYSQGLTIASKGALERAHQQIEAALSIIRKSRHPQMRE